MLKGIIIKGISGFYYVEVEDGTVVECKARGRFRKDKSVPLVGDRVRVELIDRDHGVIDSIENRKSQLIRPLVANIDQAVVIFALRKPDINYTLLNKILIQIEHNGLDSVICFNKSDLDDGSIFNNVCEIYENVGYRVIKTIGVNGEGIEDLKEILGNKISVFTGPSGAGKSTIFNKLQSKVVMETADISARVDRGKHTTRHAELIEIQKGTYIVDTPGFSTVDLSFIEPEKLQYAFKEFEPFIGECRFSSCIHFKESNCEIKNQVEKGIIHRERYNAYIDILQEIQGNRRIKR